MITLPRRFASTDVFLDSSGFLALTNPRDSHHLQARATWQRITDDRLLTHTSNYVVAETHALFIARVGVPFATDFLRGVRRSRTRIERVTELDEARAESIIFSIHR
ncbi:MAG: hypothetical protein QOF51_206 [Chloroflexota bacterium]|jgi:predicted nucleic acid-binding protein|nr:hypothetical protein [Chloroflexota bacterium]